MHYIFCQMMLLLNLVDYQIGYVLWPKRNGNLKAAIDTFLTGPFLF